MNATEVLIRWNDGALGLTGWGWIVFWLIWWKISLNITRK